MGLIGVSGVWDFEEFREKQGSGCLVGLNWRFGLVLIGLFDTFGRWVWSLESHCWDGEDAIALIELI